MLRQFLALSLGKAIQFSSKTLKLGAGSAAPGLYALKLEPNLIYKLSSQLPPTIVITGTNGKTTTARMLSHIAQSQGLKVLRNKTGSNMERGIASALVEQLSFREILSGQKLNQKFNLAIWELDEAAFNQVVGKIKPLAIVFLNVFRDQLDRYGEVDTTVKKWCASLEKIDPKTKIYINSDDGNLIKLINCFKGEIKTFGLDKNSAHKISGERLAAKNVTSIEAKNITQEGLSKTSFEISLGKEKFKAEIPLPGIYNVYDFLAAVLIAQGLNIPPAQSLKALKKFSPAFGRVERFTITPPGCQAKDGYIFLIKNPTGATEVFKTLSPQLDRDSVLLIALNDNFADGTDISWIWDIQLEKFEFQNSNFKIICTGTRAEDLALRLKYADFTKLSIEKNLAKALEEASLATAKNLFILPTYTALLQLQKIMTQKGIKEHYWKE